MISGQPVQQTVVGEQVLGGAFVRLHCRPEPSAGEGFSYEALLTLGREGEDDSRCSLHLVEAFGGKAGSSHGTGVLKIGWGNLEMRRSIMAFNDLVEVTSGPDHLGMAAAYCSDLYANWEPGLVLAALGGGEPNFSVDPCFCDLDGDDLHLSADSWCLPGVGSVDCLELVGALGEGCGAMNCQETPVEERSWSSVKDIFR